MSSVPALREGTRMEPTKDEAVEVLCPRCWRRFWVQSAYRAHRTASCEAPHAVVVETSQGPMRRVLPQVG